MEEAAREQAEQQKAVEVELAGCRKDLKRAAARTEQSAAVLERLQGEAAMLSGTSSALRGRQGMLQVRWRPPHQVAGACPTLGGAVCHLSDR